MRKIKKTSLFASSLRGQTVQFGNCKRIPQQVEIGFVPESAKLLFFFDLLCHFGFHREIAKTLHCSQLLQKQTILRNLQQKVWNPKQIHEQTILMCLVYN